MSPASCSAIPRRFERGFHTIEIAKQFIERTQTTTGLHVTGSILEKVYVTGRKYAKGFKEKMKIVFDEHLPKWNYRVAPPTV